MYKSNNNQEKGKRILVAVPTYETIYPDTFKAIYDLDKGDNEVIFEYVRGYDVATARNRIAERAIALKTDYVLMIDNDTVVPPHTLLSLLEHDVDVVGGYYANRGNNNVYTGATCVCRLYAPDGTKYFNYPTESEYSGAELRAMCESGEYLHEIHGGGAGCILIKTEVFNKLLYPWFD